jgi:hypothetical protein
MRSVCWADIPELSARDRRCPAAWQQYWLQSLRSRYWSRPSVFQAGHIPSWLESCECYALLAVTAACRWSLLLLSPLLSAVATGRAASDGSYPSSEALDDGYLSLPAACSLSARAASSPRPWSLCAAPPPIGLTAADLFAGGEVSRADSRVR